MDDGMVMVNGGTEEGAIAEDRGSKGGMVLHLFIGCSQLVAIEGIDSIL